MCYATKRRIADCVKELSCKKEIRKITIQDIMNETHMSRQSFYYHFKDIYDVIEWIAKNDFMDNIEYNGESSFEEWVLNIFKTIEADRRFYNRLVSEISWPALKDHINPAIRSSLSKIVSKRKQGFKLTHSNEWDFGVDYISSSICYSILDYVSNRTPFDEIEILNHIGFLLSVLEGSNLVSAHKMGFTA